MRIYCLEDEDSIRELLIYTLEATGFSPVGFTEPKALYAALEHPPLPDLILLDIMLPGEDGISVLRRLRRRADTRGIPVIMLTAKSGEVDKVRGLDEGADDYVTKPFGMMELVSRIRAVLRRAAPDEDAPLYLGPIMLDPRRHRVEVAGSEVALTVKEFALLELLMAHPGQVFTRDQLLTRIWGYDAAVETRTVDVHIRTLRQKLGKGSALIDTVRGVGYRMEVPT